jgi:hypothetical protein
MMVARTMSVPDDTSYEQYHAQDAAAKQKALLELHSESLDADECIRL